MAKHPARCPKCGGLLQYESAVDEKIVCPACQVLLSVPGKVKLSDKVDPLAGKTLGQFEIVELLGRGGMGAVYKARQPTLDRFVAVKVLPRALARDAKFIERFQREARDAAAVTHPNIIPIYDVGQDKGFQYIAMEFVEGESLADVLKRDGPLPVERALDIFKQVAAALAVAHAKGIVHRDIKPGNIMLTVHGHAKLADFGLAKRTATDVTVTQTGAMMGTPLYFPPEAARNERYDARSDLYSLGATFYHLLAGKPPFEGENSMELAIKHHSAPVPPLKQAAPDAPMALCGIIHRLLQKKATDRFQTADDLLAALHRVAQPPAAVGPGRSHILKNVRTSSEGGVAEAEDGRTVTAGEPQHLSLDERRAAKAKARKKLLIIGGAAAAIVLVLVLALVLVFRSGARPQASSGPPTPITESPTPSSTVPPTPSSEPPSRDEANAEIVFRNAQTMAARLNWQEAQGYLDRLHTKYGKTAFYAARRADIEALQAKVTGILSPQATPPKPEPPKPEPKKEEPPKPEPKKEEPKPKEKDKSTAKDDEDAKRKEEEERQRQAEARKRAEAEAKFAEAMKPIEALVARWDFAAAVEALAKTNLPKVLEPSGGYAERLATRKDELERLAKLKLKMIERINTATPKLRKGSLLIPGINADLAKADDKGITAQFPGGKTESHDWAGLSDKSVERLVHLAVDKDSPDDHLAAGLLFLTPGALPDPLPKVPIPSGGYSSPARDAAAAEQAFEKAKALGASIGRYLDPLAAASFSSAKALLDKKDFPAADAALGALEKKYGATPWLASHKDDVASAREAAKSGIAESEAEKLYSEAAKLFEKKELFDLKPLIEKLKTDYPNTRPVTEQTRKPSFAEMLRATETLGKFITVRQDGKGDFKAIQAAIDAAPPNSLIEIQDKGPYREGVVLHKQGVTIGGGKGLWPVITSRGAGRRIKDLAEVSAPGVTVQRVILAHDVPSEDRSTCLVVRSTGFRLNLAIACIALTGHQLQRLAAVWGHDSASCQMENSVFCAGGDLRGPTVLTNCLLTSGMMFSNTQHDSEVRHCTTAGLLDLSGYGGNIPATVVDSIVSHIAWGRKARAERCDFYGRPEQVGTACFTSDPQFRDPANLDYRLKPTSPCRGKASDGGDIGCRYTPEMMELLEKALELRKKGIIKF